MAPSAATSDDELDLSEWLNHRVLAKQEDIYVAGIIRSVDESNTILVEFDYPEGTRQIYYNVLGAGRFDVISDASPSAGDVIVGSRVCIRIQSPNRPGNVFVEGIVVQIHNDTKQFVVQIANAIGSISSGNDEIRMVKRGQIRLLRPPWWDELNDPPTAATATAATASYCRMYNSVSGAADSTPGATETVPIAAETAPAVRTAAKSDAAVAIYGGGNSAAMPNNRPANHRLKYITGVEQGTPLQLHHVLPTLQVSTTLTSFAFKDRAKILISLPSTISHVFFCAFICLFSFCSRTKTIIEVLRHHHSMVQPIPFRIRRRLRTQQPLFFSSRIRKRPPVIRYQK